MVSSIVPESKAEQAIVGDGFGNGLTVIARRLMAKGPVPVRDPGGRSCDWHPSTPCREDPAGIRGAERLGPLDNAVVVNDDCAITGRPNRPCSLVKHIGRTEDARTVLDRPAVGPQWSHNLGYRFPFDDKIEPGSTGVRIIPSLEPGV